MEPVRVDDPRRYGDSFADVYDEWYRDVGDPAETAAFLRTRINGLVVEFGSGTGRLARALTAAGIPVVGVDASEEMVRRARPSPDLVGDMGRVPVRDGAANGVLIAFNTLFNVTSTDAQREVFREAARILEPGGALVVEAFVPGPGAEVRGDHIDVARIEPDVVVLRVSRTDPTTSSVVGHHVELRDGAPVRLRPWTIHFQTPGELDALADAAGMRVDERFADWAERPFDDRSEQHVTIYRTTEAGVPGHGRPSVTSGT